LQSLQSGPHLSSRQRSRTLQATQRRQDLGIEVRGCVQRVITQPVGHDRTKRGAGERVDHR
jgi:hypothetical protein